MPAHIQGAGICINNVVRFLVGNCRFYWNRNLTETVDPRNPVIVEGRIDDAVMTRGVIETVFVGNNANVCEIAEEDECSKLILFAGSRSCKAAPQSARACAFEINAH